MGNSSVIRTELTSRLRWTLCQTSRNRLIIRGAPEGGRALCAPGPKPTVPHHFLNSETVSIQVM